MSLHIHLDPVGGIGGDMFVAALMNCFPQHIPEALATLRDVGLGNEIEVRHEARNDGILTGSQFLVETRKDQAYHAGDHAPHRPWHTLRTQLEQSRLAEGIKSHTIGIFQQLAAAEAQVHGVAIDEVTFHEVGQWDSIADIVAASALIHFIDAKSWSIGALPIGAGRVKTAHGDLPVPAPATALLLKGFAFFDDGREGERVTPTGAAILKYLSPRPSIGNKMTVLTHTGFGFGTRKLPGISNVLRVLGFTTQYKAPPGRDLVGVIAFEIDDQSGEELAVSLDIIRHQHGVLDVAHTMMMGKKGRILFSIQVLTRPDQLQAIAETCFQQTTTLGVRTRLETRQVLSRKNLVVETGEQIKLAMRPGGETAKADIDEVKTNKTSHLARKMQRASAENRALEQSAKERSS